MRSIALVASILFLLSAEAGHAAKKAAPGSAAIQRGRTLVTVGSCSDCHTPMKMDPALGMPVPDMDRYLSGHPESAPGPSSTLTGMDQAVIGPTFTSFKLPFATAFTANITPDEQTGIGSWTEAMFVATMRTGRHLGVKNGRPLLPPMPWFGIGQLSDQDLSAIWAYLRSIKPIQNRVPQQVVAQPALDKLGTVYDMMVKGRGGG